MKNIVTAEICSIVRRNVKQLGAPSKSGVNHKLQRNHKLT